MRHLLIIIILLLLALAGGALLAMPVFSLLQLFFHISPGKVIPPVISITGFLLLILWLRQQRLLNRTTLGYAAGRHKLRQLGAGFLAGILIMVILAAALVLLGIHRLEPDLRLDPVAGLRLMSAALVTGMVVALVEETLYRGALLGGLLARVTPVSAILFSSVLYAAVHFLKFNPGPDVHMNWYSGLALLPSAFYRLGDPGIVDAFLTYLAFGILLALARLHSGALYLSLGLHAGAVFALRLVNKTTDYVPGNAHAWMVNDQNHTLGLLAFLWLSVCLVIYRRMARA